MNKRILHTLVLLFCVLGTYAYNVGDYVLTDNARLKVTGENLLVNGDLAVNNVSSAEFGWATPAGVFLSPEHWTLEPALGPDGMNAMQSQSAEAEAQMYQAVAIEPGKAYVISMQIKGSEKTTSSNVAGQQNMIDVYTNADGTQTKEGDGFVQVSTVMPIGDEWTEVAYSVVNESAAYLVVNVGRMNTGTQVAAFEVREAKEVYDLRQGQKVVDYCNMLLGVPEFTEEREGMEAAVQAWDEMSQDPASTDDKGIMESLVESIVEAQASFLDANSADMMGQIGRGKIVDWGKKNSGSIDWKNWGDWTASGTNRWSHASGSEEIKNEFHSGYDFHEASIGLNKGGLPAGKYMFSVDLMACKYMNANGNKYTHNYAVDIDGNKLYFGADSLEIGVLPKKTYKTYTIFGTLAEGDTLKVGHYFPGFGDGQGGGFTKFTLPVLRLIGTTTADMEHAQMVKKIIEQQGYLLDRIATAKAEVADPAFPWWKQDYTDSIAKAEGLYQATLTYIDAEGNETGEIIPEYYDETVRDMVSFVNSCGRLYVETNKPYTELVAYVPEAQAVLDDPATAGATEATRTALKAEIAKAQALIDGVTATPDPEGFMAQRTALEEAVSAYMKSQANFESPAEIVIVNGDFSDGKNGWELSLDGDSKNQWGTGASSQFSGGYKMAASRGNTVTPKNKAIQYVTVTEPGMYAYYAEAYGFNSAENKYNGMWNGLSGADSTRISGINLFFGPKDDPEFTNDSVSVCTHQTVFGADWTPNEVRSYILFYEKKTAGEEVLEFGMDALTNGEPMGYGCNIYGFGSNRILFYGNADDYRTGISGVPAAPAADNKTIWSVTGVKMGTSASSLPAGVYIRGGKKFVVKK